MGCLDAVASCLRRNRVNGWHPNRCTNGHSLGLGRPVLCTACHDNYPTNNNDFYPTNNNDNYPTNNNDNYPTNNNDFYPTNNNDFYTGVALTR